MQVWPIVFALALGSFGPSESLMLSDVLDIIRVGKDVTIAIAKTWNLVDEHFDVAEVPLPIVNKRERLVLNKLNFITSKVEKLQTAIEGVGTQAISTILRFLPEKINYEIKQNELLDYITRVNIAHIRMSYYVDDQSQVERLTLEDFARSVVSHEASSVQSLLERIHAFIVPSGTGISSTSILEPLVKITEVEGNDMFCNMNESPQQLLLNLYNTIALTELKGYSMIQFSYMLLKLYGEGNFTKEAEINKQRYEERSRTTLKAVREAITGASRELWKCDPKKHIKGETYLEITELLQGYIQNEVDLNPEGTCRENCAEYTYTKSHSCYKNLYCRQQRRCNGKIINCQFIDSDAWVCPAALGSNRRYEYIEYENGRVLGRKQGCTRGTTKVDSWWRWLFWHCSYCVCLCDEQGNNSDRYFNMRSSEADINNNRVVTGLRFVKKNRVIHLQIQEGKLQPRAKIDVTTVHWKPVDEYKITDRDVFNEQDFHTLTWEKRNFDLDDLSVDSTELLTGVRFKMIGSHLNFEIKVTPFDFTSGKLEPAKSYWKDNANTDVSKTSPRRKLNLDGRDIPIRATGPSYPDSKSDQYLEFTHTDLERDVAQTTIPYIDSQPVESLLPVPLNGAGIFHKGSPNFGGFIAPKIITYDYSKLLENAIDDSDFGEEVVHRK